jgi:hypothetical protein
MINTAREHYNLSGLPKSSPGSVFIRPQAQPGCSFKIKKPLLMIRMGFLIAQKPFRFDSLSAQEKGLPAFKPILNFRFVRLLYQVMI